MALFHHASEIVSPSPYIDQRKASNDMRREEIIEYSSTTRRAGVDTTNPYKAEWKPDPAIQVEDSYSIVNWAGVLDGEGWPILVQNQSYHVLKSASIRYKFPNMTRGCCRRVLLFPRAQDC